MSIDINTLALKSQTREIEDSGKVQIGNMTPSFPPVRTTPTGAKDSNKVEIGNMTPSFPPVR
jgi:hypothetical protein